MKRTVKILAVLILLLLVVSIAYAAICGHCRGVGWNVCIGCNGAGTRQRGGEWVECTPCLGTGQVTCYPCGGTGER